VLHVIEGRVRIREAVVFARRAERELRCDVYSPPAGGSGAAVLLIHGGGWHEGDRRQLQGYAVQFARRGLVAVACEYRLSGEALWPAQLEDVEAAFDWMTAQAEELGIDPDAVAVVGNSAGGHLALLLAANRTSGSHRSASRRIAAVVALYAPARLLLENQDSAVARLLGPGAGPGRLREASPLSRVAAGFPPTLLLHGNGDDLVPSDDSVALYRRLRRLGVPSELHVYDGAPHGFDGEADLGRQCVQVIALFLERRVVLPSSLRAHVV
jgi:acetyl esterase/lipase